jgi:D-alanyl-D-alanine-carboxypeptidase/D-alanyl-D-alanine-endopeptidase
VSATPTPAAPSGEDAGSASDLIANRLVTDIRSRPWGLGVVTVHSGQTSIQIDPGDDPFTDCSLFELGSVTKTFTGFLLAAAVLAGECTLNTTVGDVLGPAAGSANSTTLLQLATHTSGFPRLPVGFAPTNNAEPYADLDEAALLQSISALPVLEPGAGSYSNLGFILLGILLERISSSEYEQLLQARLLQPLGMKATTTNAPDQGRLPGYRGPTQTPWWRGLPGAGCGVVSNLRDMATYLRFALNPSMAPERVAAALKLATSVHDEGAQTVGLGWRHQGGGLWHNGGTGGFHTMTLLFRPTGTGVFLVGNAANVSQLDQTAFAVVTEIAKGQFPLP